ncbi:3-hydroxyacyl-CoA dehydrogenase family protein, partial [Streptococcus pneumoniae]|nr:3-hydroxyacyl-CoA dehydrogenase family protein [Streptococcus pneumoniae]
GELLWSILAPTLVYSAQLHGEIADDIVAIDNAMKWGFGWEQGPFEVWDAIGVKQSIEKMAEQGLEVPSFAQALVDKGF